MRVFDQAFRFGARDQGAGVGEQIDVVEFAVADDIGQRLVVDQPIEIALGAGQLIGCERSDRAWANNCVRLISSACASTTSAVRRGASTSAAVRRSMAIWRSWGVRREVMS